MGFEVKYLYHERTEDGYDKTETKTFKKKVGDPFDDVPLEKLAGAVMAQMARRDIYVVDAEIFELSKKQISFKETKGGIVLKNKKFLFDGEESTIVVHEMVAAPAPQPQYQSQPYQPPMQYPHEQQVNIQGKAPNSNGGNQHPHEAGRPRRPVDWVVFSPELPQMPEIKQKNLRFTPDKKYPVFEKREGVGGEIYVMTDDTGREQLVSDKYFVPGNIQLFADKELKFSENQQQRDGGKLYWGGANNEPDMPDIRRG